MTSLADPGGNPGDGSYTYMKTYRYSTADTHVWHVWMGGVECIGMDSGKQIVCRYRHTVRNSVPKLLAPFNNVLLQFEFSHGCHIMIPRPRQDVVLYLILSTNT